MSLSSESPSLLSTIQIPISIRWKISKAKLLEETQNPWWHIESDEFTVEKFPGLQYSLVIGDGRKLERPGHVGFGLTIFMPQPSAIDVNFEISLPYANCFFRRSLAYNDSQIAGRVLCKVEELFDPLNNYFINGFMVVHMEGILCAKIDDSDVPMFDVLPQSCNLGLKLWDRDDKDFAFIVDDKQIKVHKNIVSANSPVFDRMIQSGLKESTENKVFIIDFDFETVESALKFCYGIEQKYSIETAIKLIHFGDKYDIADLKTFMERFLLSKISPMDACKITNASITSNCITLREKCFDFILECCEKKMFIMDLNILDKDFVFDLFKASLSQCSM